MSLIRQSRRRPLPIVRGLAVGYPPGFRIDEHGHDWDQLVYARDGVLDVRAGGGAWVVPPHRALWVPAETPHALRCVGAVALRTVYLPPRVARELPRSCCVLDVTPLLRELVTHVVAVAPLWAETAAHRRLAAVLVDQLTATPIEELALPWPSDARAVAVADRLHEAPGDPASVEELALAAGTSPRTIERLFRAETGLPLGRWRQQARALAAVRLLEEGRSVTEVALDVGYESTSAFIAMFKRQFGTTPGRAGGVRRTRG